MVSKAFRLAVLLSAIATSPLLAQPTLQLVTVRHASGQGVSPVYEGFDVNADGSFNMWFGYMNRNYEEAIDLPVGAANAFDPGGDRGQPTHFTPRRHKDVFRVTVPKDFGDQKLTWKLTAHGQTQQVAGTLKPVWQIDRLRTTRGGNSEKISSNLPPVVDVQAADQRLTTSSSTTLTLTATDDGLPQRRGQPVGMTVMWAKYRGPGAVQFSEQESKIVNGTKTTTVSFGEPGEYILQAVVDDGSGESAGNFGYHCCWTNTQVTITVTPSAVTARATSAAAPPVTFAKDVAPIFQKSCQTCHHQGTSAPMSLGTYEEVRPWAKSIQQRVANREMPPWHLDKTVGIRHYKNDRSLSDAEIATVVTWVDAGAPQGNPADLPSPLTFQSEANWFIGEPDLKVTTPNDFAMYANGPDWWIDQFAEVTLDDDRWIKAMEIKPSNPKIVHHVVVYVIEPDAPEGTPETGVQLHEYGVGKFGDIFGENTGRLLKKGTRLRYDMHYFAVGSEQHNKTTIAFTFYPKGVVPKYQVRSLALRNIPNDELEVPPNTVVRTDGYFRLPRNARIDAFQPHMHMRGRGMTLEAINPVNNTTQILSSVDHFDFNWHINYVYADDVAPLLPAGTVLHMIGIHDNTAANRRNPDPNMWVGFGERSVDDMLQVWVNVVYLDDADFQRLVDERKAKPASTSSVQNR
jgi:mono/diheme cytochrome c family protein